MSKPMPVWDLPVRLFHWLIVAGVGLVWLTGELEAYEWHARIGYAMLTLILFRLCWGIVGSRHARFRDFVRGPQAVGHYLKSGTASGNGHNPLGGWSVICLLTLLLLQAVSGLFNTDEVFFQGPLHYWAGTGLRGAMGEIHEWAFDLLLFMVGLHIAAVLYYQLRRGEPLIGAMIRGYGDGKTGIEPPVSPWLALWALVTAAILVWAVISYAPQPVSPW